MGQTYRIQVCGCVRFQPGADVQMDHLPFWHFPPKAAGAGLGQGTGDIIEYVATLRPSTFVRPYAWMVCVRVYVTVGGLPRRIPTSSRPFSTPP